MCQATKCWARLYISSSRKSTTRNRSMGNFTLNFQIPLEPQQLVMAGGDQDPLEKTFSTTKLHQYERLLFHKDEPRLPCPDFLLGSDEKILSISTGKRNKINHCVSGCTERSRKWICVNVSPLRMWESTRGWDYARLYCHVRVRVRVPCVFWECISI